MHHVLSQSNRLVFFFWAISNRCLQEKKLLDVLHNNIKVSKSYARLDTLRRKHLTGVMPVRLTFTSLFFSNSKQV